MSLLAASDCSLLPLLQLTAHVATIYRAIRKKKEDALRAKLEVRGWWHGTLRKT